MYGAQVFWREVAQLAAAILRHLDGRAGEVVRLAEGDACTSMENVLLGQKVDTRNESMHKN